MALLKPRITEPSSPRHEPYRSAEKHGENEDYGYIAAWNVPMPDA